QDLRRALGLVNGTLELRGNFEAPPYTDDRDALTEIALEQRADLRARQRAVDEAEAALRLAIANRFGNPTLGAAYTYDPTRVNDIGAQINVPIPVLNTHRGQIL